jgi:hypothetical protein
MGRGLSQLQGVGYSSDISINASTTTFAGVGGESYRGKTGAGKGAISGLYLLSQQLSSDNCPSHDKQDPEWQPAKQTKPHTWNPTPSLGNDIIKELTGAQAPKQKQTHAPTQNHTSKTATVAPMTIGFVVVRQPYVVGRQSYRWHIINIKRQYCPGLVSLVVVHHSLLCE